MIKKVLIILFSVITIFSLVFITIFKFTESQFSGTYKEVDRSSNISTIESSNSNKESEDIIKQTEPLSILLMGVDTDKDRGDEWIGNSDTMILLTINPNTNKTTMTSLQRDLLLDSGKKLNSTYQDGGAELTIKTVEELLDIRINKFIEINMEGLISLVDSVGGIEVNNEFDFPIQIATMEPQYTATIDPGVQSINGEQALVYARMRYDDPRGDYGRQLRQQEVIKKVVNKVIGFSGISNYDKVIKSISSNLKTDIRLNSSTIPALLGYKEALNEIETLQIEGYTKDINGISYEIPSTEMMLTIQNRIKKELEFETSDELNSNVFVLEDLE